MLLTIITFIILVPVVGLAIVSRLNTKVEFRGSTLCRGWISLVFLIIGVLHFVSPSGVTELIPPFFPFAEFFAYASGALEIALAILLWTRYAKPASLLMIACLIAFLPFNIYGWTVLENSINYRDDPFYLWIRVPMQGVFIALAYFAPLPAQRVWRSQRSPAPI
jgi:uncharacterized membrane protein